MPKSTPTRRNFEIIYRCQISGPFRFKKKIYIPSIFLAFRYLFTISESELSQLGEKYFVMPFSPRPSCFSRSDKEYIGLFT